MRLVRPLAWVSVAMVLVGAASVASADVTEPNGEVVPAAPANLSGYLNGSTNNDGINEGIDAVHDASVLPESFSPLCDLSGKYIAKGGGANFAVGWYNVDDARPSGMPPEYVPTDLGANLNVAAAGSDIQILFPFAADLPANPADRELSAMSIRSSAAYMGGLIGLVLVPNPNGTGTGNATQYHYTEHRFNIDCTLCSNPGPWYSHLIYRSNMLANTFYLGFEDLDFTDAPGNDGVNGNDLDYEDFLFRFTGLACPGAGQPCTVPGNIGACAAGVSDCDAQGNPICTAIIAPGSQTEVCDGQDNDCNGSVDDGAPCPGEQICSQGRCVDKCGAGEFKCGGSLVCDNATGVCVESTCVGVECTDGKVCHGGTCTEACEGVTCPVGQVCNGGACADPCDGLHCGTGLVCVAGVCVTACSCAGCDGGLACDDATGQCVDSDCVGVHCDADQFCGAGGTCKSRCDGATCPVGEKCQAGACVTDPNATTASSTGTGVVIDGASTGASHPSGSGTGGAGAGGDGAGAGFTDGNGNGDGSDSGCGCRVAGEDSGAPGGAAAALLGVLAIAGLRRRRS